MITKRTKSQSETASQSASRTNKRKATSQSKIVSQPMKRTKTYILSRAKLNYKRITLFSDKEKSEREKNINKTVRFEKSETAKKRRVVSIDALGLIHFLNLKYLEQ